MRRRHARHDARAHRLHADGRRYRSARVPAGAAVFPLSRNHRRAAWPTAASFFSRSKALRCGGARCVQGRVHPGPSDVIGVLLAGPPAAHAAAASSSMSMSRTIWTIPRTGGSSDGERVADRADPRSRRTTPPQCDRDGGRRVGAAEAHADVAPCDPRRRDVAELDAIAVPPPIRRTALVNERRGTAARAYRCRPRPCRRCRANRSPPCAPSATRRRCGRRS